MLKRRTLASCLAIALAPLPYPDSQQRPPVKTTTAGVLIDVSVLDRNGRPVLDLTAEEFDVAEDGTRQQVLDATLVTGGTVPRLPGSVQLGLGIEPGEPRPNEPAPSSSSQLPADVPATPTVTAILFDRLSAEARPLAGKAALTYLSTLSFPDEYAGVFMADISFRTFQPFTNDPAALQAAIDRVVSTVPSQLTPDTDRARNARTQAIDPGQPPTAGAEFRSGGFGSATERERKLREMDPIERVMALIEWRMERSYRAVLAEYDGQATLAGLRAVVDALGTLPGRKSVFYFSENVSITSRLRPKFDLLIGLANRANITFYPVDAAGLRVHSKEAEVARNGDVAGAQGVGDAPREDGPWTKELERQEQLLASRPSAALGRLARETGGFLLQNTNDLAAGISRMEQERTTYYLLAYQPTNAALDGKFRRVQVKVKRRGLTVKARPGYVAAPAGEQ